MSLDLEGKVEVLTRQFDQHDASDRMIHRATMWGMGLIVTLLLAVAGQLFFVAGQLAQQTERLTALNSRVESVVSDTRSEISTLRNDIQTHLRNSK